MNISLTYFAALREQAGRHEETLKTEAETPGALYRELQGLRDLQLDPALLRVAVNECYATMDTPLSDGDRVAFIPPVAGG